jgi:Putative nuclear envelope organisation protein
VLTCLATICRDNYASASGTIWGAWSDSDIRNWLVENGYLRSGAQVKRDELVKAINDKYKDASTRTAAYLTWPDARLRAYLRERGVSERALPTSRPGLLRAFFPFCTIVIKGY